MSAMSVNLQPIAKQQSIRDRVKGALRAAIIAGEMTPGTVYSAPSLAAEFGISATPVREAMLDLVKEGMVEMVPNKGFRVTEVDEVDLDEITAVRQLIEPPVVRDVVRIIPDADLPDLREMAEAIVMAGDEHDLVEYLEADNRFHLALLEYSGNARLVRLVDDLRGQARLVGLAGLADRGELHDSAAQHIAIVDAIAARDADLVYRLMVEHLSQTRGLWAGR